MNRYPFIKSMILNYLMTNNEVTGYEFITFCKKRGIPVSSGTVYPHLKDLTSQNILTFKEQNQKKIYSLTEQGRAKIEETSLGSIPEMVKQFFFRNISQAAHMDWQRIEDVERLLFGVQQTENYLKGYIKELKEKREEL